MTEMLHVLPVRLAERAMDVFGGCEETRWSPVGFWYRIPRGIVFHIFGQSDCTRYNRGAGGRTGAIVSETGPRAESGKRFCCVHGAPLDPGVGELPALLRVHRWKVLVIVSVVNLADGR